MPLYMAQRPCRFCVAAVPAQPTVTSRPGQELVHVLWSSIKPQKVPGALALYYVSRCSQVSSGFLSAPRSAICYTANGMVHA